MRTSLLLMIILCSLNMKAAYEYTDSISGLIFRVISVENMTGILAGSISKDIEGDMVIPETFPYANHEFTVVKLTQGCLESCNKITSVTIPNTVESLGFGCFQGCSNLESVLLPSKLKEIGGACFAGCNKLKSISLPPDITDIGDGAFNYCYSLKTVIIEDAGEDYTPVYIKSNVGHSLFNNAEELYYGRKIAFIRPSMGMYCIDAPKLKKLILGKGVDCWIKKESYTTSNEYFSFESLPSLEVLESQASIPPSIPSANNAQYMYLNVYVPEESLDLYKTASIWKSFWNLQGYSSVMEIFEKSDAKNPLNVYNLQGKKIIITNRNGLKILPSGIYIVNGKQTLIK